MVVATMGGISDCSGSPATPVELLTEDVTYPGWEFASARLQRFYVTGCLEPLAAAAIPDLQTVYRYWSSASVDPRLSEGWRVAGMIPGSDIAYNQFLRVRNRQPLLFDKAVKVILTLEHAVRDHAPDVDVYSTIAIVPAVYCFDGLDTRKIQTFAKDSRSLLTELSRETKQNAENILSDMAKGFTVTLRTARLFQDFLDKQRPDIALGRISFAGGTNRLGSRKASPHESIEIKALRADKKMRPRVGA